MSLFIATDNFQFYNIYIYFLRTYIVLYLGNLCNQKGKLAVITENLHKLILLILS